MSKARGGLGRGLEVLLGEAAVRPAPGETVVQVPVTQVVPGVEQPRRHFDKDDLKELATSIREHGVLVPLIVIPLPAQDGSPRYGLVAGERRWRAAQQAGLSTVPVLVRDADRQQQLELALVENLQRADLGPLETARAFARLTQEFGLTQEQVAQRTGRSRAAVANVIRLLRLPPSVLEALEAGILTEGHGRALLVLESPDAQEALAARVIEGALSVRQTEALARSLKDARSPAPAAPAGPRGAQRLDPDTAALERAMRESLGARVALQRGKSGGKVTIWFTSEDELEAIYTAVTGGAGPRP